MEKNSIQYLIIGNSAAGISAAKEIRRQDSRGDVTILSDEAAYGYSRVMLPLFIAGKISEAMAQFKQEQRAAVLSRLKDIAYDALKEIGGFLKELDISWSVAEGKLEIKLKGG